MALGLITTTAQPWPNFCMQDCHSWIALLEYQDQTLYTRVPDCKILLIIYGDLPGFYLRKVRTENLKFRTDLQDQVVDGWSVTQQMIVYKGRLLKNSSNTKQKLVLSMHGFQPSHFICYLFDCKLWLQSIQKRARYSCQNLQSIKTLDLLFCTGLN